jgi:hypothetical protein
MGRVKITAKTRVYELPVRSNWNARLIRKGIILERLNQESLSGDYLQFPNFVSLRYPLHKGESIYVIWDENDGRHG